MNEVEKNFGFNAGKLWDILNADGPQVQTKIMNKAGLTNEEFYGALGWLARENKVCKEKRTYKIGETNLTSEIGSNAGKVWQILTKSSDIDITAIAREANIAKTDCYAAIGWLAREGKVTGKVMVKKKK